MKLLKTMYDVFWNPLVFTPTMILAMIWHLQWFFEFTLRSTTQYDVYVIYGVYTIYCYSIVFQVLILVDYLSQLLDTNDGVLLRHLGLLRQRPG